MAVHGVPPVFGLKITGITCLKSGSYTGCMGGLYRIYTKATIGAFPLAQVARIFMHGEWQAMR
jgi:hypothetical protein